MNDLTPEEHKRVWEILNSSFRQENLTDEENKLIDKYSKRLNFLILETQMILDRLEKK